MSSASETPLPRLKLRVSDAVLDKIVVASAQSVSGVVDVHGTIVGALVGGVVGGAIGFAQGGPIGSALGVPVGTAIGSAAGDSIQAMRDRSTFYQVGDRADLSVRLAARSDASLVMVANSVRNHVAEDIKRLTGIEVGQMDVDFVEWLDRPDQPEQNAAS